MNLAIGTVDATILIAYLIGVVLLGVWIGRGRKDLSTYLLGGRDLPWWAILGSIVATETSTATFLSVPGIAFAQQGDLRFLQIAFGFLCGRIIVAFLLLPQYFQGELYSAYEVLEKRFGGATQRVASLMFLVARNLGDGLRLFLAGIAMEKVIGLDLHVCIALIGIATIIYTFFGGMKAVVWSDCIQFVVYVGGGILALLILVRSFPGGWSELVAFGEATGRLQLFDFRFLPAEGFSLWTEPFTFWAGLLGGTVLTLGTHGTDQMMVQRYLCARNQQQAALALILSGCVIVVQFALFLLLGIALACFYTKVSPQVFEYNDEVFATFIVEHLPVGLIGVTLAAVFAAAMSTLSSSLNSSASAAVNDIYQPRGKQKDDEASSALRLKLSRFLTILFGIVQIGVGIGASYISRSVVNDALAIAGFTAGILLGIFSLGILTKRTNQRGALIGILAGIAVLSYIKFGTSTAWTWYAIIGAVTTFTVGYGISVLFPNSSADSQEEVS
ncbi:MAG: sodium:solute symporter [Planctomycetales bacterium]|nr:sodium:solute symporter [Planctomycetales bacterium]